MSRRATTTLSVRALRGFVLLLLHCWVAVGLPAAHAATEAVVPANLSIETSLVIGGPERELAFDTGSIGALAPDADAHDRGSCTICRAAEAPNEAVDSTSRRSDERVVVRPTIPPAGPAATGVAASESARAPPLVG